MNLAENITLYVSKEEQKVIAELVAFLDGASISLNDEDYVSIFRAIADEDRYAEKSYEDIIAIEYIGEE